MSSSNSNRKASFFLSFFQRARRDFFSEAPRVDVLRDKETFTDGQSEKGRYPLVPLTHFFWPSSNADKPWRPKKKEPPQHFRTFVSTLKKKVFSLLPDWFGDCIFTLSLSPFLPTLIVGICQKVLHGEERSSYSHSSSLWRRRIFDLLWKTFLPSSWILKVPRGSPPSTRTSVPTKTWLRAKFSPLEKKAVRSFLRPFFLASQMPLSHAHTNAHEGQDLSWERLRLPWPFPWVRETLAVRKWPFSNRPKVSMKPREKINSAALFYCHTNSDEPEVFPSAISSFLPAARPDQKGIPCRDFFFLSRWR